MATSDFIRLYEEHFFKEEWQFDDFRTNFQALIQN